MMAAAFWTYAACTSAAAVLFNIYFTGMRSNGDMASKPKHGGSWMLGSGKRPLCNPLAEWTVTALEGSRRRSGRRLSFMQ